MTKKYIDADKLIAKIVELRKELPDTIEHFNDEESGFARGQQYELTAIESEILCLQQEQPEGLHFTPLNRLIQKIPSKNWNDTVNNYAKKLRDCLIKEGYLKDAKLLQDYISYMNGNNVPMATMDEQEQLEMDLEKEVKKWKNKHGVVGMDDLWLNFAHYFYELGGTRKEE